VKRLNGVTATFLSLALLLGAANGVLIFFTHIPVDARLRPRTYFQAYGAAELLLASIGLGAAALASFLLYRQSKRGEPKASRAVWAVSMTALLLGVLGLLTVPHYLFFVGILLIGACLSFSARQPSVSRIDPAPALRTTAISH